MALQLRSGPAIEPVTLSEAKNFLRLDSTEDDVLISSLITAARIYIETTIGKILITESWSYFIDKWPKSNTVYLPLNPIQEIEEVRFYSDEETYQIIPPADYSIDIISNHPRLKFKGAQQAPISSQALNQIEVRFIAGYGDNLSDIPADLKQALLMLCAHWFEQRDPIGFGGSFAEVPTTIQALLHNHKKYRVQ